jgi:cell division septal protein FtsQ
MRIHHVDVSGTQTLSPQAIQQVVEQSIAGGYGHLFARSNIFLYPKEAVAQNIQKTFPTIKNLTVKAQDFQTLAVVVVERQPVAVWCGASVDVSGACNFLDEDGFAYAPAAEYSGDAYQKYYGALVDGRLLTSEQFRSLVALVASIQKAADNGALESIVVDSGGDIHLAFENGFVLLFRVTDAGGDVLQHFTLARGATPFKNNPLSNFEYLDLRFGDKVYYKVKGG